MIDLDQTKVYSMDGIIVTSDISDIQRVKRTMFMSTKHKQHLSFQDVTVSDEIRICLL